MRVPVFSNPHNVPLAHRPLQMGNHEDKPVRYAPSASIRQIWRDAVKSVLLPIDQNEQMPSAFETARLAASLLDGVVEVAALTPVFTDIVAADSAAAVPSPPRDRNKAEYIRRARQSFDNYAKQHST